MTLEIENLVGGYSRVPVLKDISFTVKAGELVGLIGLNGAGKSTTIKHIIGLLRPQKGKITLEGVTLKSDPKTYKQKMAYIPETPILYEELTLREHIELTIMAYGLEAKSAWQRAQKLLELDPLATQDLLDLIDQKKQAGAAVLMSTHVLSTAQEYCDRFVMIDQGQVTAKGDLASLRTQFGDETASLATIYLKLTGAGEKHAKKLIKSRCLSIYAMY